MNSLSVFADPRFYDSGTPAVVMLSVVGDAGNEVPAEWAGAYAVVLDPRIGLGVMEAERMPSTPLALV